MAKTQAYEKARKARLKEGAKLLKERIKEVKATEKLERTQLKTEKFKEKQKEKSSKKWKALKKKLSKRITSRKITKPSKATITIKEREPTNIFHEESKFFKKELDLVKQEMFLK